MALILELLGAIYSVYRTDEDVTKRKDHASIRAKRPPPALRRNEIDVDVWRTACDMHAPPHLEHSHQATADPGSPYSPDGSLLRILFHRSSRSPSSPRPQPSKLSINPPRPKHKPACPGSAAHPVRPNPILLRQAQAHINRWIGMNDGRAGRREMRISPA